MIDAKLRETHYAYDDLNRLIQINQDQTGINAQTQLTYDAANNLLTVTDPENTTTTYTYDRLSRRTSVQQQLGQTVTTYYDSRNRVDYVVNARGHKIDYSYELWGGLKTIEYYDSITASDQRPYDYVYLRSQRQHIEGVTDDSIQAIPLYSYTYDALNRPDQVTAQLSSHRKHHT